MSLETASLTPQQRRILIRAWRRGLREMDILLGGFVDMHLAHMSDAELNAMEVLLDVPDQILLQALVGQISPPEGLDIVLFERVRLFKAGAQA